jgi:hypothetical protein
MSQPSSNDAKLKESTMPTSETPQRWSWPAGRAIVLYHWAWYDQRLAEIITGWSQRNETDDAGYIHLEAERLREPRTMQVDQEGIPQVESHTLSGLTALPQELRTDDGRPLAWLRSLLGTD